jgi:hypothetical protein
MRDEWKPYRRFLLPTPQPFLAGGYLRYMAETGCGTLAINANSMGRRWSYLLTEHPGIREVTHSWTPRV